MRGIVIGTLLSVPLWALIAAVVWGLGYGAIELLGVAALSLTAWLLVCWASSDEDLL